MDDSRLTTWLESTAVLPDVGRIGVFNAWPGIGFPGIAPERLRAVQPMAHLNGALERQGLKTARQVDDTYDAVILRVPREKERALGYLRDAVRQTADGGPIIVDGQKTDGIEGLLKICRDRFEVQDVVSKAHGKLFWFRKRGLEKDAMRVLDLPESEPTLRDFGFYTAPGVFSADGPDPGSVLLADSLPVLKGRVADLGAGWGYLAHRILEKSAPEVLHLVEADWLALSCAKLNVTSARAAFDWADARDWRPDDKLDHVVTNPPFHAGRSPDPSLGQAFVRNGASILAPRGTLWLVANRHLPYEKTLEACFASVQTLQETAGYKIIRADRPRPHPRG